MAHFRFSADSPGYVFVKSCKIKLLKDTSWLPDDSSIPKEIIPDGLSLTWQWYLYDNT